MAVPRFNEFLEVLLKVISDGKTYHARDVRKLIREKMQLSDEDMAEMLPSGKQTAFDNRVAWAKTYLTKAGLICIPTSVHFSLSHRRRVSI